MAKPPAPFVSSHSRRDERAWSWQIFWFTRISFSALLEELRDQPRPSRLVVRAHARAVVAVEVLVEQEVVAEVRIALQLLGLAEGRPAAVLIEKEDGGEAAGDLGRHLSERHLPARTGGKFDGELFAQVVVELLQRLDEQEVHGEPDGAAPVGIPPEEAAGRFRRLVAHAVFGAVDPQPVRLVAVHARE